MAVNKPRLFWLMASLILAGLIIVASFVVWIRYQPEHPIEISLPSTPNFTGVIFVSGAVANPGLYPFTSTDSIESLIQAAGGFSAGANLSNVKLSFVPESNSGPQKININTAEPWLLEALPGIGTTLAQRIVQYREQNGLFRSTSDILKISGMGTTTYQHLAGLITIGD
jgi:competence protein ComEA